MRCPVGEARITIGGELDAPWCIHAVGPCYKEEMYTNNASLEYCDCLLKCAYENAMVCAAEEGLSSLAFALLSAGKFRGPQSLINVLEAGVCGISTGVYPGLTEVHMVSFTSEEKETLQAVCDEILIEVGVDAKIPREMDSEDGGEEFQSPQRQYQL